MTKILLSHNPYIKETFIKIGTEKVSEDNGLLSRIKNQPSGMWIESILCEMVDEFNLSNNRDKLSVEFCGTQEDFEDLESSVEDFRKSTRVDISLSHKKLPSAPETLKKINLLFNDYNEFAKKNKDFIGNTFDKAKKDFEEAILPNSDVNVIATMSSGKSTLINSIVGQELLPAANEATTATITRILDNDDMMNFEAVRINKEDQEVDRATITPENKDLLKEWNKNPETREISLEGNIIGVDSTSHSRLRLVDTPGPNNSQDPEHGLTTHRIIKDKNKSVVLYVLNATQQGINDDSQLLSYIKKEIVDHDKQSRDRFMFVVNKIDAFDPEKEPVQDFINKVRDYLEAKIGIQNPNIYPVSAKAALLIRQKQLGHKLTIKEKAELATFIIVFNELTEMNMLKHMPVSPSVKRNIETKLANARTDEEVALIKSGIPIIEAVINEYIEKYSLPSRVNKCFSICDQLIEDLVDKNEAHTDLLNADKVDEVKEKEIAYNLKELGNIEDLVEQAKKRPALSTNFKTSISQNSGTVLKELSTNLNSFSGQVDPTLGKRKFKDMVALAEYASNGLLVKLEKALEEENLNVINELKTNYMDKVKGIFAAGDSFAKLIQLEFASVDFTRILNPISGQPDILSEEVRKTGTRTVQKRAWYKLWLGTRDVEEEYTYYDTVKYIDLDEEASKILTKIKTNFNKLVDEATTSAQNNRQQLITGFANNVKNKLSEKILQINKTLDEIKNNRSERQPKIAKQAKILVEINQIKNKFKEISSFI